MADYSDNDEEDRATLLFGVSGRAGTRKGFVVQKTIRGAGPGAGFSVHVPSADALEWMYPDGSAIDFDSFKPMGLCIDSYGDPNNGLFVLTRGSRTPAMVPQALGNHVGHLIWISTPEPDAHGDKRFELTLEPTLLWDLGEPLADPVEGASVPATLAHIGRCLWVLLKNQIFIYQFGETADDDDAQNGKRMATDCPLLAL